MALKGAEGGEGEGEGEERGPGSGSALGAVDIRPILEMNQKYLHSPSVKQRISVFEASIASAVSSSGNPLVLTLVTCPHSSKLFIASAPLA